VIGGLTLIVVLVLRRDLMLFCFDTSHARTIGIRTNLLYYLLLTLLAATVVASLKAVGIILVISMLITPGCVGFLLAARFGNMMWIAVASAVFSTLGGIYVSFFTDASTSACIVLIQAFIFVLTLFFAPRQGWLANRRARIRSASEKMQQPVG
jgi:ABC-type Mn2+/Zn2+ transport system permease subunit